MLEVGVTASAELFMENFLSTEHGRRVIVILAPHLHEGAARKNLTNNSSWARDEACSSIFGEIYLIGIRFPP